MEEGNIKIEDLSIDQLKSVLESLQTEINNLSVYYSKLKDAQNKYNQCKTSALELHKAENTQVMVPLTNSLYVDATLNIKTTSDKDAESGENDDCLIVDVGTGYYVSKTLDETVKFYEGKIDYVQENSVKLLKTINEKQKNLKVLQNIIVTKQLEQQQEPKQQEKQE